MHNKPKTFTPGQIAEKAKRIGLVVTKQNPFNHSDRIMAMSMAVMANNHHAKKTNNLDAQLYQDIYSAGDLALQTAISFLNGPKPFTEQKYDQLTQLADLGFKNTDEVKTALDYKLKENATREMVKQLDAYKRDYPFHKFIDADGVKVLCEKYGLMLAAVDKYKADIPNKNQIDILTFKVSERIIREPSELNVFPDMGLWFDSRRIAPRRRGSFDGMNITSLYEQAYDGFVNRVKSHGSVSYELFGEKEIKENTPSIILSNRAQIEIERTNKIPGKDLCILAPERMLITHGNAKKGHILLNDPVVLQPVKYGFLIVTSWGLEASDDAVMNPKNN